MLHMHIIFNLYLEFVQKILHLIYSKATAKTLLLTKEKIYFCITSLLINH